MTACRLLIKLLSLTLLLGAAGLSGELQGQTTNDERLIGRLLTALERAPHEERLVNRLREAHGNDLPALLALIEQRLNSPVARLVVSGRLYLRAGDASRAAELFTQALELSPNDGLILRALATALDAAGDVRLADVLGQIAAHPQVSESDRRDAALRSAALRSAAGDVTAALAVLRLAPWTQEPVEILDAADLFGSLGDLEEKSRLVALAAASPSPDVALNAATRLLNESAIGGDPMAFASAVLGCLERFAPGSLLFERLLEKAVSLTSQFPEPARLRAHVQQLVTSAHPPRPAALLLFAAALEGLEGDHEAEARLLAERLGQSPGDTNLQRRIAEVEMRAGEGEAALARIEKLLAGDPKNEALFFDKALCLLRNGRESEAGNLVLARVGEGADEAFVGRAAAFLESQRLWGDLERLLTKRTEQAGGRGMEPFLALAAHHFRLAAPEKALEVIDRMLAVSDGEHPTLARYIRAGEVLSSHSLFAEASERLRRALALSPSPGDETRIRLLLAEAEAASGRTERARLELLAAAGLESDPDRLEEIDRKLFSLLGAQSQPGATDGARTHTRLEIPGLGSLPLRPAPNAAAEMTDAIMRHGDELQREVRLRPSTRALRRLAFWRRLARDHAGALDALDTAATVAVTQDEKIRLLRDVVSLAAEAGLPDRAVEAVSKFPEAAPPPARVVSAAASALADAGRMDEALALFAKSAPEPGKEREWLIELARLRTRAELHADALAAWQRALELSLPTDRSEALGSVAMGFERLGRAQDGAAVLEAELDRAPTSGAREDLLRELAVYCERNRLQAWQRSKLAERLARMPDDDILRNALAALEDSAGDPDASHIITAKTPPRPDGSDAVRITESARMTGQAATMLASARRAAAAASTSGPLLRLAALLEETLDVGAAQNVLEGAARLFPRDPSVFTALETFHRLDGNSAGLLAALVRLAALEPARSDVQARLLQAAILVGNEQVANDAGRAVLRLTAAGRPQTALLLPAPLPDTATMAISRAALSGEQQFIQAQADFLRVLVRMAESSATEATPGTVSARRSAIRWLLRSADAAAVEGAALLKEEAGRGDFSNVLLVHWLRGERTMALDLLSQRIAARSGDHESLVALIWLCLVSADESRLTQTIAELPEEPLRRVAVKTSIALHLASTPPPERTSLAASLLPLAGDAVGQAQVLAMLALHDHARLAAEFFMEMQPPDRERAAAAIGPDRVALWLMTIGQRSVAWEILDGAIRAGMDERLGETLELVRRRLMITPSSERPAVRRLLVENAGRSGNAPYLHLADLYDVFPHEPTRARPVAAGVGGDFIPEQIVAAATLFRSWNQTDSAITMLEGLLRGGFALGTGGESDFALQIRSILTTWRLSSGQRSPFVAPSDFALESELFLQNTASLLEAELAPLSAAGLYQALAGRNPAQGVYTRSMLEMFRVAGRPDLAAAELMRLLGDTKTPGATKDLLLEQAAPLANDLDIAQLPEITESLLKTALAFKPDDPRLEAARSNHLARTGRTDLAFDAYRRAAEAQPDRHDALAAAAGVAGGAGRIAEAIRLLESRPAFLATSTGAASLVDLRLQGNAMADTPSVRRALLGDKAGREFAPLIRDHILAGRHAEGGLLTSWALERLGGGPAAVNLRAALLLSLCEEAAPDERLIARTLRGLFGETKEMGREGITTRFLVALEAFGRKPASPAVVGTLRQALSSDAPFVPLERLIPLAAKFGNDELMTATIQALSTHHGIGETSLLLAVSFLLEGGRVEQAVRLAEVLVGRFPLTPAHHTLLALARHRKGDFAGASAAVEEALALAPFDPDGYARAALCLSEMNRTDEAIRWFNIWEGQVYPLPGHLLDAKLRLEMGASTTRSAAAALLHGRFSRQTAPQDVGSILEFLKRHHPEWDGAMLLDDLGLPPFLANKIDLARLLDAVRSGETDIAVRLLARKPHLVLLPGFADLPPEALRNDTPSRERLLPALQGALQKHPNRRLELLLTDQ